MNKTKIFQRCLIGIILIIAGGIYLGTSITKAVTSDSETDELVVYSDPFKETNSSSEIPKGTVTPMVTEKVVEINTSTLVFVHVCGSVKNPNVYELKQGSRLVDAISAAGGFLEDAACDKINQAQLLMDGQRVYIPNNEEVAEGNFIEVSVENNPTPMTEQRININCATKEELMTLPGIGEAKAAGIIAYRTEHNGFQTIEDIQLIAGVKEAIFSKVKDLITVE